MNITEEAEYQAYLEWRKQCARQATPADNLPLSNKPKADQNAIDALFDGVKPFPEPS